MLNHVTLQGRLTRDAELRTTQNGISTASFTLAVDRNYQSGEQKVDFINCVAWRQTAEFITKYFKKGDMILVEGSIQTRSWDGGDGKPHYATDVIVNRAHFCGNKHENNNDAAPAAAGTYSGLEAPLMPAGISEDDLPF